jgi:hypothetical protein
VARLGLDKVKLVALMNTHVSEANLNELGRFDDLKASVYQQKAKPYFEGLKGKELPLFRVTIRTATFLQDFIIQGGCYPTEPYRYTVNRRGRHPTKRILMSLAVRPVRNRG